MLAVPLLLGAAAFFPFLAWGLPTRQSDAFLFGLRHPWPGEQILRLAAEGSSADPTRASDVSSKPLDRQFGVVTANASDSDRARIVRRYRLMSFQPDEFTTFAALSGMRPGRGDLDPRMYKYGGLWVYPVGAFLKIGSLVRAVRLTPDPAFYLDHPAAFGRFYVVARLYSAMWGMLAVLAVLLLVRKICGSANAAMWGGICFALMPVVVTAAHEAKPHLAGTALTLWAVLAGAAYAECGGRRSAVLAALLSGAAIGMVPSASPVLLALPAMIILRQRLQMRTSEGAKPTGRAAARNTAVLLGIALLVFCITNPYIPINIIRDHAVLRSNVGNSSGFYHASLRGLPRALVLVMLGMTAILAAAGVIGAIALAVRAARKPLDGPEEIRRRTAGLLLASATLPTGLIFLTFATGQPADYARFALPLEAFLAIEAVVAVQTFIAGSGWRIGCFALLALSTGFTGVQYLIGFQRDCGSNTSRTIIAAELARRIPQDHGVLASREEPGPWSLPPVDLFRWNIVLPPRSWPADLPFDSADLTVGPADFFQKPTLRGIFVGTPISWADKPFHVQPFRAGNLKP